MGKRRDSFYWIMENGKEVPYVSVTNVLSILDKPALKYWFGKEVYMAMVIDPSMGEKAALASPYQKSKKAMDRGSTVHSIIEAWKTTEDISKTMPSEYKGYARAFMDWIKEYEVEVIENERTVISKKYGYGGTMDMLAKIKGSEHPFVIDFKTNDKANLYDEVEVQLSAYSHALEDEGIKIGGRMAIALAPDSQKTVRQYVDRFDEFLACRKLWLWKNKAKCEKVGYKWL